jgi:hypothetical protein
MVAKRSMLSRIIRLLAAEPARDERGSRCPDDDRLLRSARETERKPADAVDAFVWSWQFPGQW